MLHSKLIFHSYVNRGFKMSFIPRSHLAVSFNIRKKEIHPSICPQCSSAMRHLLAVSPNVIRPRLFGEISATFCNIFTVFNSKTSLIKLDLWLLLCFWNHWHDSLHPCNLPGFWPFSTTSLYLGVKGHQSLTSQGPQTETAKPNPDRATTNTAGDLRLLSVSPPLLVCEKNGC